MRYTNKIVTIMGVLLASSAYGSALWCPKNDAVTAKIEELANNGTARLNDKTYHLIGRADTSIFYTEQLLENDGQLNGFLTMTKILDPNQPNKAEARLIDLLPTPNFCPYKISLGENSGVIALSPVS